MSNPLYEQMNRSAENNNFIQQFERFKMNFSGNPKHMIQQMLNSGKISQAQYNQAVQTANRIMKMMK